MTIASSEHITEEMSLDVLADAIKKLNVRAQNPAKLDDVLDLIEYLREQAVTLHEENTLAAEELHAKEINLNKREAELAIKSRAVMSILNAHPQPQPPRRSILDSILWR
jgi:hypothetical protein